MIIGAGPAGLTAAFELASRTDVHPIVLEASPRVGGLSTTFDYKGNRIDIGGHRFFSRSDRVIAWWLDRLPLQRTGEGRLLLGYHGGAHAMSCDAQGVDPDTTDRVMLVRDRRSRVYWRGQLIRYPISLSFETLRKMGIGHAGRAALSYAGAVLRPRSPERNLEDFLINRFGGQLYRSFFRDYTEKVWGVPCTEISPEWGAQRIRRLSAAQVLRHGLRRHRPSDRLALARGGTPSSLAERFLYPKYGPGQMWEVTAEEVRALGGEIRTRQHVERLRVSGGRIVAVRARDTATGLATWVPADHVLSSMPVPHLARALGGSLAEPAAGIAEGLAYRDFFTVGLLVDRLKLTEKDGSPLSDNWIYIHEPSVMVGRVQFFNNWSPYMVADPDTAWLGLEYFCQRQDPVWSCPDRELVELGAAELEAIGIIDRRAVRDACVIRVPLAYPAYVGSYSRMADLRRALDVFPNLYCIGRNGQHRYNNQDHSMLTAMLAVDAIADGADRSGVWTVNTDDEYHGG